MKHQWAREELSGCSIVPAWRGLDETSMGQRRAKWLQHCTCLARSRWTSRRLRRGWARAELSGCSGPVRWNETINLGSSTWCREKYGCSVHVKRRHYKLFLTLIGCRGNAQESTCHRRLPVWFYRITGGFLYAFSVSQNLAVWSLRRVNKRFSKLVSILKGASQNFEFDFFIN